jgi:hypothetical protein
MNVTYRVGDRLTFELEEKTVVDVVERLHQIDEVFDNLVCPVNNSKDVHFVVREDKEANKYYELRDRKSGYKLAFGQHKKGGTLFPRRKDAEGNWLPNQGWTKWEGKKDEGTPTE